MKVEEIKQNEEQNVGKYVHLYFNKEIGMYTAYGLSAYLLTFVINPLCSYSEELGMPVALITRKEVKACRLYLKKIEHRKHAYYLFEMDNLLPKDVNYCKWEDKLKMSWA